MMFLQLLLTIFSVVVWTSPVIASTSLADFEVVSTEFMGNKAYLYTLEEESAEVKTEKVSFQFNSFAFYWFVHECTFNSKNNRFKNLLRKTIDIAIKNSKICLI